jgi:predicted ferric reductase
MGILITKSNCSVIGKFLFWLCLTITTALFFLAKSSSGEVLSLSWLIVSQYISLIGLTLLGASFLLSGRFMFMEKLLGGLDRAYKSHHIVSGVAFVLLLHHPLFLLIEALPNLTLAWKYVFISNILPYNYGVMALYAMALMLILTILVNLPYSLWKKTHELMGVSLLFSSLHILTVTSDVSRYMPLRIWVVAVLIVSVWAVIYKRFLYSIIGPVYLYRVSSVKRTGDILDVWLKPKTKRLFYHPAQFVFAEFVKFGKENHPFSIASNDVDGSVRLVIKILGDHTLLLRDIKVDDSVRLWGPYGAFFQATAGECDLVWIAGGVGISPFLGLLDRQVAHNSSRKVVLYYCYGRSEERAFGDEIVSKMSRSSNLKLVECCSADRGRITVDAFQQELGELTNKKFMLCGPVPMMESLTEQLHQKGVASKNIIYEDFNLK